MPLLAAAAAAPAGHSYRLLHLLLLLLLLRWQWVQPRPHPAGVWPRSPAGAACEAKTQPQLDVSQTAACHVNLNTTG
jgi:hypothetical protein